MKKQINQDAIKEKMEQYHMTQYGLAKAAGVSRSMVSRILTGKINNPTLRTLLAIAEVLETTVDELLC